MPSEMEQHLHRPAFETPPEMSCAETVTSYEPTWRCVGVASSQGELLSASHHTAATAAPAELARRPRDSEWSTIEVELYERRHMLWLLLLSE